MIHLSHRTVVPMLLRAITAATVVFSLTAVPRLPAQDSSKSRPPSKGPPTAVMVSGPDVGRRAPTFRLPWASTDGVGPADQPYDLALDRGKTVVLAFYPRDFTNELHHRDADVRRAVRFAVRVRGRRGGHQHRSTRDPQPVRGQPRRCPFRLLSDPTQEVARRYASNDRSGYLRRTVYVIGPDGKVQYRNLRFNVLDPKHYAELGAAVRRSRGG